MKSVTILASTLGWDIAEVSECRYQRYTLPSVYTIATCTSRSVSTAPSMTMSVANGSRTQINSGPSKTAPQYGFVVIHEQEINGNEQETSHMGNDASRLD